MHDQDPWGLQGAIEIDAYAKLTDGSGKTVKELHILYFSGAKDFTPLPLTLTWKQVEEIHILVDIDYKIVVTGSGLIDASGQGSYQLDQGWRVVYGDSGLGLEARPLKHVAPPIGKGNFAIAVDLFTDQSSHETGSTYVSLLVRLRGGYTNDGVTIGVKGVGATLGKSSGSYVEDYELKLNILVVGKPDKPEPIVLPADLLRETVYFDERTKAGKAPGEDQPNLSVAELHRLEDTWIKPLQSKAPELFAVIKSGDCPLTLKGYASDTADPQYDMKLSQKRIDSVIVAITGLIDSKQVKFTQLPLGHNAAKQTGAVAREKRVEILIDPQVAQQKIAAKRKK